MVNFLLALALVAIVFLVAWCSYVLIRPDSPSPRPRVSPTQDTPLPTYKPVIETDPAQNPRWQVKAKIRAQRKARRQAVAENRRRLLRKKVGDQKVAA